MCKEEHARIVGAQNTWIRGVRSRTNLVVFPVAFPVQRRTTSSFQTINTVFAAEIPANYRSRQIIAINKDQHVCTSRSLATTPCGIWNRDVPFVAGQGGYSEATARHNAPSVDRALCRSRPLSIAPYLSVTEVMQWDLPHGWAAMPSSARPSP